MTETSTRVSRRHLLTAAGAVVALAGSAARADGGTQPAQAAPADAGRPVQIDRDQFLHVARRLSHGPSESVLARMRQVGVDKWIAEQLDPEAIADNQAETFASLVPVQHNPVFVNQFFLANEAVADLQAATLIRQIWSERQLFEVVVAFWNNHFSVNGHHRLAQFYMTACDGQVARAHAFGKFSDMLLASAKSAAMLTYLDNWVSDATNINENYGREILELHTVGVHGGYTEDDVRNAAYALTGWTIDPNFGTFAYDMAKHYVGPLKVMGWRHPNPAQDTGQAVGESLIAYLARHPSTARFLAEKLCRRFVSDTPPASLVASAAQVYTANDTAIVPVLKHIFASKAFRSSVGAKYRRPHEFVAATVRALGSGIPPFIDVERARGLIGLLQGMAEAPFEHGPPDGYSDDAVDWLSTIGVLGRWNAVQAIMSGSISGIAPPNSQELLGNPIPATAGACIDALVGRLLFQRVSAEHHAVLLGFLGKKANDSVDQPTIDAVLPQLCALVLSSPYMQAR